MRTITINKVIEDFNLLLLEEKEYALDVIKRQLIEAKRTAIAKRYRQTMNNFKKGNLKQGTAQELYNDLESD